MTTATDVHYFDFGRSRLAYRTFGSGRAVLLAFHGFGQSSQSYEPVGQLIGDQFTVLAIDHFHHGISQYGDGQLLTKTSWQRLIGAFLKAQNINRFSLMGFSLGGRFALATVEAFADRLDQLILIAPDGITRSLWYRLATGSGVGRWLFRFVLRHLSMFNWIGHSLTRIRLLNRTAMRFAEISLGTPEQRRLVYQTWTQFRFITPDLETVSARLNHESIRVRFFTGAFDRIVPGHYVLPLTKRLQRYELTVLKTGHNHLIEMTAGQLAQRPLNDLPESGDGHDD